MRLIYKKIELTVKSIESFKQKIHVMESGLHRISLKDADIKKSEKLINTYKLRLKELEQHLIHLKAEQKRQIRYLKSQKHQ